MDSPGEAETKTAVSGGVLDRDKGQLARLEAFKKLTWPERKLVFARNKAVARFLVATHALTRILLEEDPFRSDWDVGATPEWRAELARILDAHPLPDAMLQAGDYLREYTLPK